MRYIILAMIAVMLCATPSHACRSKVVTVTKTKTRARAAIVVQQPVQPQIQLRSVQVQPDPVTVVPATTIRTKTVQKIR